MNLLTTILNLFKKTDHESSEANQRWIAGSRAFQNGMEFYVKGKDQLALDCFDTAIELGFENSELYGIRGSCRQSLKLHVDAIDDFNKAIASEPDDSNLYFMRSNSKGALGDLLGRIADLQVAIRVSAIDNAANRSHNEGAREQGHRNGVISIYQFQLAFATNELEFQKKQAEFQKKLGK